MGEGEMNYRRVAINAAVVLAVLLGALLLWEFRQALVIFLFSLSVAAAIRPWVERGNQRGLSKTLSLALIYLMGIGLFAGVVMLAGYSLLNELQRMSDALVRAYDRIWIEWPGGTEVQQMIVQQLPEPAELYQSFSPERQNSAMQALLGFTLGSFTIISNLFAVIFLSFYWSLDQVHFERLWLSLFPVEARARYRDIWRAIERDLGVYIRSEALQSLLVGIILGIGFWAMGLPFPTLLGASGALFWLIPWMGGVLTVLPVALVGFSTNFWLGLSTSLYTIITLFVMELVVEPRFLKRRQYSSLLSILMIMALSQPFGLLGFIVAPPLAAAVELIIRYSLQTRATPLSVESAARIAELRERIEQVRTALRNSMTPIEPQTINMLERIQTLVDKAGSVVEEQVRKRP